MGLCRFYACTLFLVLTLFAASASAKTIAAGGGHSCAISSSGKVMCWGDNSAGQLGIGYNSAVTAFNYYPVKLDPQDVPVAIAAGGTHTCVLLKTGLVKCWGDNSSGQLGTGKISSIESIPVSVVGLNHVKAIAAGLKHTCALYSWGYVKCWGNNQYGQLGNGSLINSALPVSALYISGLIDLAVGDNHSCALSSDKNNNVFCWGKNEAGQLGNKSTISSKSAVFASLDKTAISVAAGGDRTCAILTDKTVQCWGWWFEKVNAVFYTSAPQPVTGLNNIGNIAVGQKHTCVRDVSLPTQPKLKCWGNNSHAEVGLTSGATPVFVDSPTAMSITDPVIEVAAGSDHTCAIATISGVPILKCWGNNTFGQLGLDPKNTYLKTDPKNPSIKFSPAPITISIFQISATSAPLDTTSAPPIPPPAVACVYTYSEWSACKLESWGYWQTRYPTSKSSLSCVGEPILGQYCTPPPPPPPLAQQTSCPLQRQWIYWYNGQPHQECGCITVNADKDAAGKPIPWMGDKFAMVYFAGGRYQVDWTYRKDGLPIHQGPWYYAAKDGSVNGIPNGFTSNAAIPPINGYTYLADNQPWAAMKPKKVYVSGSKLGSTWKNCSIAESPGGTSSVGGGSPTVSPTEQQWVTHKAALDTLMTKLGQSAVALAKTQEAFRKETREKLDPYLDKLLQNSATPVPSIVPSTKIAEMSSIQAQLQYDFKLIVNILSTISKKQDDSILSDSLNKTLLQASIYYLSAIFNVSYSPVVTASSACYTDPVAQQLIFQYGTKTLLKQDAWSPLSKLISGFHCMPIEQLNNFDRSFTAAFKYAVEMIGSTHPAYKTIIQDQLLQIFSPVIVNLYEVVRSEGSGVPVRSLVTLLWDRMKTVPDKALLKTDAGIALDPTLFGLYNSEVGKPEQISTACIGTLTQYWVNNCLIFRSFVHALNDPSMDDFGSCPFWTTLRLGKACQPSPPKTSWLKKAAITTVSILENALVATAHADTFGNCEAKGMESDMCGKCVPKSVGDPQGEAPKTQCEILCSYCTVPQGCVSTLFCPFDSSKKGYCPNSKGCKAADGSICPGGPNGCMTGDCGGLSNCVPCAEVSQCLHNGSVNYCKMLVQDCLGDCSKSNNISCTCGNWKIDPGEECDDGNMNNGDGCSASCKKQNACGNGKLDYGEECDDGNKDDWDKCHNDCTHGAGVCGDGVKDADEKCDDGSKNGYPGSKCSAGCYLLCGNGIVDADAGEKCDTGKNTGWDGCNKECQIQDPVCGNGHTEKGETCDDGNTKNGDNCSSTCQTEKKYCDQCKYPNFKGKSAACDKYYAQMESSQKPGCTIASTPWDGSSCTITPYKKGDPCWMQLPFSLPACRDDPAMVKCVSDCVANEGNIPPDVKLDCDQGPLKKMKSGGYDTKTLDEMKKIYNDNWDKAIQAFKLLAGSAVIGDVTDAKQFGVRMLEGIRTCNSDELSAYTFQTKGGIAGALYMPDKKEVCYNQATFNDISKVSAERAIVHEAMHAVFDRLADDAKFKQLKPECGFPDFYASKAGGIDHWVFNILNSNELIKNPLTPNGFNSVMCPKSIY